MPAIRERYLPANPLKKQIQDWLPQYDFAVIEHHFLPHGRDYVWILQTGDGTYELILTHVVECTYETRVRDDVWPMSWEDVLTDYDSWQAAGEPDGYVWGTNWSPAYPGLEVPDIHEGAAKWSKRVGRQMYAMAIETDRFRLSAIFHDSRSRKLSGENSIIRRSVIPATAKGQDEST